MADGNILKDFDKRMEAKRQRYRNGGLGLKEAVKKKLRGRKSIDRLPPL